MKVPNLHEEGEEEVDVLGHAHHGRGYNWQRVLPEGDPGKHHAVEQAERVEICEDVLLYLVLAPQLEEFDVTLGLVHIKLLL